jgi:hypothetical protein
MLAQTPMEKPSSTGSPIFCSYSTQAPSEMSGLAGSRKRPPNGKCTPNTLPTSETMPSSGGSVSTSAYSLPSESFEMSKNPLVVRRT